MKYWETDFCREEQPVIDEPIKFHDEECCPHIYDTELREIGEEDPEISRKIDELEEALCGWKS